jgi:hypothetical protein
MHNTAQRSICPMNAIRNLQPRDWMIAAIAFLAGAIIF